MKPINRREALGTIAGGVVIAGSVVAGGCAKKQENSTNTQNNMEKKKTMKDDKFKNYKNADFYVDGKFDADKAKQAYYEMMKYHNYPIVDRLKGEEFWAIDFGLGNFMETGMGGIFWVNNQEYGYFGHEIYLLPGQMIPEHWHMPTAKGPAKMEAWQPRHGWCYLYSEGKPTPGVDERIPPLHRDIAIARHEVKCMPGETVPLAAPEQKHWMMAGPEGLILTEYATFHDNDGLRFTHPKISFG